MQSAKEVGLKSVIALAAVLWPVYCKWLSVTIIKATGNRQWLQDTRDDWSVYLHQFGGRMLVVTALFISISGVLIYLWQRRSDQHDIRAFAKSFAAAALISSLPLMIVML